MPNNANPPKAANDNQKRGATAWPLRELYSRGELGINEMQNRTRWAAAQRFKKMHDLVSGEQGEDSAASDWRELAWEITSISEIATIVPLGENDGELELDDNNEWSDPGTSNAFEVVDNAGFNVFRDLPPAANDVNSKQEVALAASVLGSSYPVLVAGIMRNWTLQMIGETEGTKDAASARAMGKGLLRLSLQHLVDFFLKLDRMETDGAPTALLWPLVGTPAWQFAEMPDIRWKREVTKPDPLWRTSHRVHPLAAANGVWHSVDAA